MQDFLTRKYQPKRQTYQDNYTEEVLRRAKQSVALSTLSFKTSTSDGELQDSFSDQLQYIFNTYSLVIMGVLNTALFYPSSVKLVKRLFKLKGFLNIHVAITPILFHTNAIVLGCTQGYLNARNFRKNYKTEIQELTKVDILSQL